MNCKNLKRSKIEEFGCNCLTLIYCHVTQYFNLQGYYIKIYSPCSILRKASINSGGLPTSMVDSNEQWDLPNGWAPLIHLFVTSLRASGHRMLMDRAADVALKWIKSAYNGLMQPAPGVEVRLLSYHPVLFSCQKF